MAHSCEVEEVAAPIEKALGLWKWEREAIKERMGKIFKRGEPQQNQQRIFWMWYLAMKEERADG
ncbi:MAG: hypothetical protein C5B47_06805 [Verrucomicrobia bacterium]|nr:MAG: hypothetical protein C5B47_06805 [Verrucomicrobiota bacterium]